MPYCLYLRKSRADIDSEFQGGGETLIRHEKALLNLARCQNLYVTQIYREIVSGETIEARPVMQYLLSEVEKKVWDGVLVMEIERLARGDTIDQGIVARTFKLSGTKIITPIKTYNPENEFDEEYFEFGLFMSRREYKTINRRMQRGRTAAVKEGKYIGSKPPYGYNRKKITNEKGFTLEPEPEKAVIVQLIFNLYTYGEKEPDSTICQMGISKIVKKLNLLKIPAPCGSLWVYSSIQNILHNPVYIGKIRWNCRPIRKKMVNGKLIKERPRLQTKDWIISDGLHKPLIDLKTWKLSQKKLSEHKSSPCNKQHTLMNPLAGLIICGICGHKMIRRPYLKTGYPDTLMCPSSSCSNISVSLEYVEKRVIKAVKKWLQNYRHTLYKQTKETDYFYGVKQKTLHTFEKKLNTLEKQKENICSYFEQGVYDLELFNQRLHNVDNKIHDEEQNIYLLKKDINKTLEAKENINTISPKTEYILEQYENASCASIKNELLKEVLEKAVYTKKVNGRWHGSPDDFELILYPKLPKGL